MKNDLDTVLRSLGSTALGSVRLKPFSDEPAPPLCSGGETSACELKKGDFEFYRDSLLKGLNFPYREASAYPPAIISGTSRVGVIDTQLDVDHCAFAALKAAGRLIRIGPAAKLATVTPPIAPCEWMLPRANVDISTSHGTHVAGIIAGRYKDLVWGLNPYVTLFTGHVPLTGTADAEEVKLGDLSELLASMLTESARIGGLDVVNFSFYYARPSAASSDASGRAQRAFGDPVLQTIKTLGKNTLFVVAAGNDHEQFSAICDSRPSCFDLPNVISVGALNDSSPTAPLLSLSGARGSNFGRRVHVATPGHNVFSSISGNYFGVLSGTSQAAPQVAAVASLLRAANSYLTPGEVKERLITCSTSIPISSNPSPDEDIEAGGVVFGGRVDAACTLEKLGWLELKSAPIHHLSPTRR